jgi:hypothetical protein
VCFPKCWCPHTRLDGFITDTKKIIFITGRILSAVGKHYYYFLHFSLILFTIQMQDMLIVWHVDPLLGNDSVNTFPLQWIRRKQSNTKNAVFWNVMPCRSCVNQSFGEASIHIRTTWRHITEDGILNSHRRENLKSYNNRITSVSMPRRCIYNNRRNGVFYGPSSRLYKWYRTESEWVVCDWCVKCLYFLLNLWGKEKNITSGGTGCGRWTPIYIRKDQPLL